MLRSNTRGAGIRAAQPPSSLESWRVTPATAGNFSRHFSRVAIWASLALVIERVRVLLQVRQCDRHGGGRVRAGRTDGDPLGHCGPFAEGDDGLLLPEGGVEARAPRERDAGDGEPRHRDDEMNYAG